MNYRYAQTFESMDERALGIAARLLMLMSGETDIDDLGGDAAFFDQDDRAEEFRLH